MDRWQKAAAIASLGAVFACSGDDVTDLGTLVGTDSGLTDHSVADVNSGSAHDARASTDTGAGDTGNDDGDAGSSDATVSDADAAAPPTDTGAGDTGNAADTGSTADTGAHDAGVDAPVTDAGACVGATDAASLDPNLVDAGRQLVTSNRCANCHQDQPADAGIFLSGKTASLNAGATYPPNLTPDQGTGLGCWTDSQIENAILNGIDDQGATLCVMPKFGSGANALTTDNAKAIATYLRSLTPVVHQVLQTVCPGDAGTDASDASSDAASDAAHDAAGD